MQKLKTTSEAIRLLDHIGGSSPQALALFFQLLNSDGALTKNEVRFERGLKEAIAILTRHGLVEVSKDIVQCIYLIESDLIQSERKAKRAKAEVKDWKETMRAKGGNVEVFEDLITGESRAANFYRNEIADNYDRENPVFSRYASFVNMLWKGNLESPLNKVLAMPVQLSFKRFAAGKFDEQKTAVLIDILRGLEAAKKDYTDVGLVIHNWIKRREERG
jgi:hypothetical protein